MTYLTFMYKYVQVSKVGYGDKLAANDISKLSNVWCYCFMNRHQHLALKRDPIANVRMDYVGKRSHEELLLAAKGYS